MAHPLMLENVWLHKQKFEDAEALYRKIQAGTITTGAASTDSKGSSLTDELAQVRQDINKALNKPPVSAGGAGGDSSVYQRLDALERENKELKKVTDELRALVLTIQSSIGVSKPAAVPASAPASKPGPPKPGNDDDDDDDDDDDCDLFGDEPDDEELEKIKAARVAAYQQKKAAKPAAIAKSSVLLDVKPWDDETDMTVVEANVRKIEMEGLVWGGSKFVEVSFGIKKLSIMCVVEDEKVSVQDLQDKICEDEDNVQSCDIAAFNKI